MAQQPDTDEAGLGEFLEFAPDEAVCNELLGRGDYGIVIVIKPAKRPTKSHHLDFQARYKLPPEMIQEHGRKEAVKQLLDLLQGLVDTSEEI